MNAPHLKTAPPPVQDRPVLSVSLGAIAANWRTLNDLAPGARTAGVIKADSYGLGSQAIARRLAETGCDTFFVATCDEAAAVRTVLANNARIFVLNGLAPGQTPLFAMNGAIPVLNSLDEVRAWAADAPRLPCAVHVDTGMNRVGLSAGELSALAADKRLLAALDIVLVMSHLACSDEPDHPQNTRQLQAFKAALATLPPLPASLAASGGIFLGREYHFDLVRPGIALYGGSPSPNAHTVISPVATLHTQVLMTREIRPGDSVGYGASFATDTVRRLAVCNIGYADGVMRSLSHCGIAYIGGIACPFAGRVSMDLLTIDVSAVPAKRLYAGVPVEIVGPNMTINRIAALAGTVHYEILTRLSRRIARTFDDSPAVRSA